MMRESKQFGVFEPDANQKNRPVTHVPPNPTAIAELVRSTCHQLGQKNAAYNDPEVIGGFMSFLTFIAQRLAFYANNGHEGLIPKK